MAPGSRPAAGATSSSTATIVASPTASAASIAQRDLLSGVIQPDESIEQQLWHKVRAQLRLLEQLRPATERTLRELDRLNGRVEGGTPASSGDGNTDLKAKGMLSPELAGAEDRFKDNERILKLCEEAAASGEAEEGAIDTAIEQLSILIALARAPPDAAESKRKKRRVDTASPSRASLSPSSRATPLPGSGTVTPMLSQESGSFAGMPPLSGASASSVTSASSEAAAAAAAISGTGPARGSTIVAGGLPAGALLENTGRAAASSVGASPAVVTETGKRKGNVKGRRGTGSNATGGTGAGAGAAAGSSPVPGAGPFPLSATSSAASTSASGSGPHHHMDPAKARRELLAHQLPLKPGRLVAFRQPAAKKSADGVGLGGHGAGVGMDLDEGEVWIMAAVEECINNDRNRYVVRDMEDESDVPPKYNTTLKAIVPLPNSVSTLPTHDYANGAQVMALYPDTTCFYRATIVSGGPGLHKLTPAKAAKKQADLLNAPYKLIFEDDGNDIKSVPASLVIERP